MVCQDAILAHDGDDVGCDGHGTEVEQFMESVELNAIVGGKSLHKFESHTAARKMRVGISVVATFGVENRHCRREYFVGHVVIADDEVDAEFFGIGYLINGFDAAVEHNDESHAHFCRKFHSFARYTITLIVAIGDVVIYLRVVVANEFIDQSH